MINTKTCNRYDRHFVALYYECGQYKVRRRKEKKLLNKPNEKSNTDPLNRPLCIKTCSSLTLHRSNNVATESTVAFTG